MPEQLNLFDCVLQTKICKYCSTEFSMKHRANTNFSNQIYCSLVCSSTAHRKSPWFRQCMNCYSIYKPNATEHNQFCSMACAYDYPFRWRIKGVKRCDQCDEPYNSHNKRDRFCSARCRANGKRSLAAYPKKAGQEPGETRGFYIGEIIRRDSGKCGICKQLVPRNLRYPDPQSASMDHIVPFSDGGLHLWDNVQLTHLMCNIKKSNPVTNPKKHQSYSRTRCAIGRARSL